MRQQWRLKDGYCTYAKIMKYSTSLPILHYFVIHAIAFVVNLPDINQYMTKNEQFELCALQRLRPADQICHFARYYFGHSSRENLSSGVCDNTGADLYALPRSQISAFVNRFLESSICKLTTGEISIH